MTVAPKLSKSLALTALVTLVATGCQASPAAGQTATPTPASDTATPASVPRQAAATAVATRDTSDMNDPKGTRGTEVCNPCMVMRIVPVAAAGRASAPITGEVTTRGKEGAIEVLSFHHEVTAPPDAATGQASGRRQHHPIIITKQVDKATPLLAKALAEGSLLNVTVEFYRAKSDGTEERYYTYELKDVIISNISVLGFTPEALLDSASARTWVIPHVLEKDRSTRVYEEISLNFSRISQTHTDGGITHEDSWGG